MIGFLERRCITLNDNFEPEIVAFSCEWCSYAAADLAGTSRIEYPPNVKIIKVRCSGRVRPIFILKAFQEGADGVIVAGCHPGECHYQEGNLYARRRVVLLKKLLDFWGVGGDRLSLSWASASEGRKFAEQMEEFVTSVKELGPQEELVKGA